MWPTFKQLGLRVIGDTIFGIGVVVLGWFVLSIKTGCSLTDQPDEIAREFPESVETIGAQS